MTKVWPAMTDYAEAVQDPAAFFRVPALAQAEFATMPPFGLPAVASGQNAVVFTAKIGATTSAVRCFTGECADGRHRYVALGDHVAKRPIPAMASAQWLDDAIELNGEVWPAITMEWVSGNQLHDFVAERLNDPAQLTTLAHRWTDTCRSMRAAELAHGDLQHGNVIVEPTGAIRLIDFDGVWIDEVGGSPPSEVGHPNYQHPSRGSSGAWGWSIDWFSALNVLVSIRALAADPTLWDLHMGENLIFREEDFWGDADIWSRLEGSPDAEVREWSYLLAEGCAHPADSPYDLTTILDRGLVAVDVGPATTRAPSSSTPPATEQSGSAPDAGAVADDWTGGSGDVGQWWITEASDPEGSESDTSVTATAATTAAAATAATAATGGEERAGADTGPTIRPDTTPAAEAAAAAQADIEWGSWAGGTSAVSSTMTASAQKSNGGVGASPGGNSSGPSAARTPGQRGARPPRRERPEQQAVQSSWAQDPAAPPPRSVPPVAAPPGHPSNSSPHRPAPMYNPMGAPPAMAPPPVKRRFNFGIALGYLMIAAMVGLVVYSIVTGTE